MQNIRRKSLCVFIVAILFLAAAAFLSINLNRSKTAGAENDEITYTINMTEGGGRVFYDGSEEIQFSGSGNKTGTVKRSIGSVIAFKAEALDYYELTEYTVNWQSGNEIIINGVTESDGEYVGTQNPATLQINSGATNVTVNFIFEKKVYQIRSIAKFISKYIVSDNNDNVSGMSVQLTSGGNTVSTVKIGDVVDLEIVGKPDDCKFIGYALLDTFSGEYGETFIANSIVIDSDFLDSHLLSSEEIVVVAVCVKTYNVTLISEFINFINVTVNNRITNINTTYTNASDITEFFSSPIEEGCYISIRPKDNVPYYVFAGFTENALSIPGNVYTIQYLNDDYTLDIGFDKESYDFELAIVNSLGRSVLDLNELNVKVNGVAVNDISLYTFKLEDVITIELPDELIQQLKDEGYFYNSVTFRNGSSQYEWTGISLSGDGLIEIPINSDLNNYFDSNYNKLRINVNFNLRYQLTVNFGENGQRGKYNVTATEGESAANLAENFEEYYNYGTTITIRLSPFEYAVPSLSGVNSLERRDDNTIVIFLNNSNRDIDISFVPKKISLRDITETDSSSMENYSISSLEDLTVGSKITITVPLDFNKEIKNWKISGVDVKTLPEGAENYKNGVVNVTLTEELLKLFEAKSIKNEVTTGIKLSFLMVIIIPSAIVPVLAAILAIFIVKNARRKKFIKAELLDEKMKGYSYNPSSMILDLKEDNYNKITEEDVKAKMKKKKDNDE